MLDQKPEDVRRITCIGAGPIGGGWAAHFLAQGYQVTSYLHDADEHGPLMRLLGTAWTSLEAIGLADGASMDNFNWTASTDFARALMSLEQTTIDGVVAVAKADPAQLQPALQAFNVSSVEELSVINAENFGGKVLALPTREDIKLPVEEQLIVELYSR